MSVHTYSKYNLAVQLNTAESNLKIGILESQHKKSFDDTPCSFDSTITLG